MYIVWSQVRRRVIRRLTRHQTMCNVLKYRKILLYVALRLRCGCVYFFNLLKTSTVSVDWMSYKRQRNTTVMLYRDQSRVLQNQWLHVHVLEKNYLTLRRLSQGSCFNYCASQLLPIFYCTIKHSCE